MSIGALIKNHTLKVLCIALSSHSATAAEPAAGQTVRIGYFANITHAQALVGLANGAFQRELGAGVELKTFVFNAGPSAVEALFADSIDLAYIGPTPAINAFIKSRGEAVRIVAGACSGGARLIIRKGSGIKSAADLKGKKLATPQLGNTQDVAARAWLKANGLKSKNKGGDVEILPIKNADQMTLFQRGEIDAAWATEPWAARLVHEAGGEVLLDERSLWEGGKFVTTHILVSTKFLKAQPELLKKFLRAHVQVTAWIRANPAAAKTAINEQVKLLTGKAIALPVLEEAYSNLEITDDPIEASLARSAQAAFELGFLGKVKPSLEGIYDLSFLKAIQSEAKTSTKGK